MRNRMPLLASVFALLALSGCSLLGQGGPSPAGSGDATTASESASAEASATPEATPTPTGPQTAAEYETFLQERGKVVAAQISNIITGVEQFNSGSIDEASLRALSEESFRTITEQNTIVKNTPVPAGAEARQTEWLNAASAIENTQTIVTNCLTATDPVCRAIDNTLTPLADALNSK